MKSSGNGAVDQCVHNLVSIQRGEVPFMRLCGVNPEIIDKPVNEAAIELIANVQENIEGYEPRAVFDSCKIETLLKESADYSATIYASEAMEEEES